MFIRYIGEMTPKEFEHKVKEMRTQALRVAHGFGFSEEEAKDVAQDVMLRLWAIHERIGGDDPVERLASIAARHACIDNIRLHHKQEDIEQVEVIAKEQNQHDALVPDTCGIILKMRQLEHRELSEIATLLGITQSSVSTLLTRARHQLLEQLKRRNQQ